jgi:pimeloyl-ACP methyl ester carboxylesterase
MYIKNIDVDTSPCATACSQAVTTVNTRSTRQTSKLRHTRTGLLKFALVLLLTVCSFLVSNASVQAAERIKVEIPSSIDGKSQRCYVILPDGFDPKAKTVPLLVSLHSWSRDCEHRQTTLEDEANRLGWIYLFPNFRGPNQHPDACGSLKAQQDIVDAVRWAQKKYPVDDRRIYLTGVSGGGHMTMLMAGRHPEIWAAASAWVGISDLAAWHKLHSQKKSKYATMMELSCGGAPGDSDKVDREYRERSPITHLHRAVPVPLEICAGVHDGHTGSVPISQALLAFNEIAKAAGESQISASEIKQLSRPDGRLDKPKKSDMVQDESFGREIHLRRHAAKSRVTIFEGGHEGNSKAAIEWLRKHAKTP